MKIAKTTKAYKLIPTKQYGFRAAAIYNYGYRLKRTTESTAKAPPAK